MDEILGLSPLDLYNDCFKNGCQAAGEPTMRNRPSTFRRIDGSTRLLITGLLLLPGFAAAQSFTHVHLRVPDTDGVPAE